MPDIRIIKTEKIEPAVKELIYKAGFTLAPGVEDKFKSMIEVEENPLSRATLEVLIENAIIARSESLALCQDCGSTIIFIDIGQKVLLEGEPLEESVNRAVASAYEEYYLRKSIVEDPLRRVNTGTNTPAFIHTRIVPGSGLKLTVYLKGGGSENMSDLRMFRPTDSVDMIVDYIQEKVVKAGPNPCPPLFLGLGIGGTADIALLNAKMAVLRGVGTKHADPYYADLEMRIEERLNNTGVGTLGFGGRSTVGGVFIKEAPAHIASLPVALNMNCHSLRYGVTEI